MVPALSPAGSLSGSTIWCVPPAVPLLDQMVVPSPSLAVKYNVPPSPTVKSPLVGPGRGGRTETPGGGGGWSNESSGVTVVPSLTNSESCPLPSDASRNRCPPTATGTSCFESSPQGGATSRVP